MEWVYSKILSKRAVGSWAESDINNLMNMHIEFDGTLCGSVITAIKNSDGEHVVSSGDVFGIPINTLGNNKRYIVETSYGNKFFTKSSFFLTNDFKMTDIKVEESSEIDPPDNIFYSSCEIRFQSNDSYTISRGFKKVYVPGGELGLIKITEAGYYPNVNFKINNGKVTYDKCICRVQNQIHEIDKMWTRAGNILREV